MKEREMQARVRQIATDASWSDAELIRNLTIIIDSYGGGPINNTDAVGTLAELARDFPGARGETRH